MIEKINKVNEALESLIEKLKNNYERLEKKAIETGRDLDEDASHSEYEALALIKKEAIMNKVLYQYYSQKLRKVMDRAESSIVDLITLNGKNEVFEVEVNSRDYMNNIDLEELCKGVRSFAVTDELISSFEMFSGGSAAPSGDDTFSAGGNAAPITDELMRAGGSERTLSEEEMQVGGNAAPITEEEMQAGGNAAPITEELMRAGGSERTLSEEEMQAGGNAAPEEDFIQMRDSKKNQSKKEKQQKNNKKKTSRDLSTAGSNVKALSEEELCAGGNAAPITEELMKAGGSSKSIED